MVIVQELVCEPSLALLQQSRVCELDWQVQQETAHDMQGFWLLSFEDDAYIAAVLRDSLKRLDYVNRIRARNRPDTYGYYPAPNSCWPLEWLQSLLCCLKTKQKRRQHTAFPCSCGFSWALSHLLFL